MMDAERICILRLVSAVLQLNKHGFDLCGLLRIVHVHNRCNYSAGVHVWGLGDGLFGRERQLPAYGAGTVLRVG